MHPSEAQLAEVRAKHPTASLHLLEFDDGAIVAKQPTPGEWKRFVTATLADRGQSANALETLVRSCLVWPDPAAFDALIEERPALIQRLGDKLSDIAGASENVRAKKL